MLTNCVNSKLNSNFEKSKSLRRQLRRWCDMKITFLRLTEVRGGFATKTIIEPADNQCASFCPAYVVITYEHYRYRSPFTYTHTLGMSFYEAATWGASLTISFLHLQQKRLDIIPMRSKTLAPGRGQVYVGPHHASKLFLKCGQQPVQRVAVFLRTRHSKRASLSKLFPNEVGRHDRATSG